mgnify:CR=1 FL=1
MSVMFQLGLVLAVVGLWFTCACCRRFFRDLADDLGDYLVPQGGETCNAGCGTGSNAQVVPRARDHEVMPPASSAPAPPQHRPVAAPTDRQWLGRS